MTGRRWSWWLAVVAVALTGLVGRWWSIDLDQRLHLHPDERHWTLTASSIEEQEAPAPHGTVVGPVLDWLDGQRSPANPYRATETFVYGAAPLAGTRTVAGWMEDGATTGAEPASTVVHALDSLGLPLLDEGGGPRFDDRYQVDLVGRMLGGLADALTIVVVALIARRVRGPLAGLAAAGLAATSVMAIQHAHFFGSEPYLGLAAALTVLATLRMDRGERIAPVVLSAALAGAGAGATLAMKLSGGGMAVVPFALGAWLLWRERRLTDVLRLVAIAVGALVAFRFLCPAAFDGLGLSPSSAFWDDQRRAQELAGQDLPPAIQWAGRVPILQPLQWLVQFTIGPGAVVLAAAGVASLWRARHRAQGSWELAVVAASIALPFAFVLRSDVTTGRYFVPMLPGLYVAGGIGARALWVSGLRWRRSVAGVAGALAVLWAGWFLVGVYGQPHTRVEASRWIAAEVPTGSILTSEAWDDALPQAVDDVDATAFDVRQIDLFSVDSSGKVDDLSQLLVDVDYVVESSPRVWDAVTRLPGRYPSTIRLFEALDDGSIGYERVATFDRSATPIGGAAEEAFSVYDHPEVRIWQRTGSPTAAEVAARLGRDDADRAVAVHPEQASANGLQMQDEDRAANEQIGTYAEDFDRGGSTAWHLLVWILVVQLLALATFVLALPAMRRLPDAGLGVAKVLGLAGPGLAVFVLVAWFGVHLTRGLVLVVVGAWILAGAAMAWRRRRDLLQLWHERRRTLVLAELVAWGAFAAMLLLRAANPDLWHPYRGGEKPFELEMFTAVLRTRTLPPYDPWFADGVMNYHYGSYLLLSIPARVARTSPALAMNLGIAVVASMAAGATWTLGTALAGLRTSAMAGQRVIRAGLFAVAGVLLLPSAAIVGPIVGRLRGTEGGDLDWWALSRTRPGTPIVTEFPVWSYLFGDLHPHVVGLTILLAVGVLALVWHLAVVDAEAWWVVAPIAIALGGMLGWVRATNTWDLPVAGAIVAVALGSALARGVPKRDVAWSAALIAAMVAGVWAPYVAKGEVTDAGVEGNVATTPLGEWLQHFGVWVVVALVLVALVVRLDLRRNGPPILGLAAVAAAVALVVPDRAVLAVALALAVGAALAGRWSSEGRIGFALVAAGWLLVAGIEVVSVANDFERQNTVFKGWYQAWALLGVGSAVVLAALAPRMVRRGVLVGGALLVVAFVQLAVPARLEDRLSPGGPRLDGLGFFASDVEITMDDVAYRPVEDRPLIEWLQEHASGLPTVAEAPGPDYSWSGRMAVHTGLPAPIGWAYHETQQRRRYEPEVYQRGLDMARLYETSEDEEIAALLRRYRIRYLVYGTVEQAASNPENRAALLTHPCLAVVYGEGDAFIAEVAAGCRGG